VTAASLNNRDLPEISEILATRAQVHPSVTFVRTMISFAWNFRSAWYRASGGT